MRKAREFLEVAQLALGDLHDAAASNAVLAAIAASDAICGAALGRRARGEDHEQAASLLREVADVGDEAAKLLRRALRVKHKSQYQAEPVTADEARRTYRSAARLVEIAERLLAG